MAQQKNKRQELTKGQMKQMLAQAVRNTQPDLNEVQQPEKRASSNRVSNRERPAKAWQE